MMSDYLPDVSNSEEGRLVVEEFRRNETSLCDFDCTENEPNDSEEYFEWIVDFIAALTSNTALESFSVAANLFNTIPYNARCVILKRLGQKDKLTTIQFLADEFVHNVFFFGIDMPLLLDHSSRLRVLSIGALHFEDQSDLNSFADLLSNQSETMTDLDLDELSMYGSLRMDPIFVAVAAMPRLHSFSFSISTVFFDPLLVRGDSLAMLLQAPRLRELTVKAVNWTFSFHDAQIIHASMDSKIESLDIEGGRVGTESFKALETMME